MNKNITSLDQIKWIFDRRKNPANFKQNMLDAIDKLPLTDNLAKKLLGEGSNKEFLKLRIKKDFDKIFNLEK